MPDQTTPFQAVLFDMDGTLVDTEPLWQHSEREIMAEFGTEWTAEDQARSLGRSTETVTAYMSEKIARMGGTPPTSEELAARFLDVMLIQLHADPPAPRPGVSELLHEVHDSGVPTALVSSSSRTLMSAVLDQIGTHWFDVTISATDVPQHKPDPLPYLTAASSLQVDPKWCLAIEDSPTGVASAAGAGSFVVAVEHMAKIEPGPRRAVLHTLAGVGMGTLIDLFQPPP